MSLDGTKLLCGISVSCFVAVESYTVTFRIISLKVDSAANFFMQIAAFLPRRPECTNPRLNEREDGVSLCGSTSFNTLSLSVASNSMCMVKQTNKQQLSKITYTADSWLFVNTTQQ